MNNEELISALIQLSRIDNHFDEFEFTYILKVGQHLGIEDKLVEKMIKDSIDAPLNPPSGEQDRMTVLYHLLFMMKVDKKVDIHEVELIHHYGFKLGFSKNMIDDFIKLVETHLVKNIPTEEMLAIIKKYNN